MKPRMISSSNYLKELSVSMFNKTFRLSSSISTLNDLLSGDENGEDAPIFDEDRWRLRYKYSSIAI